ncbi:helix-turn-helix transcriptional regulator [Fructobacillus sp. CRL 2054]|uniref:helix-turn-helix domain-containing protein n=1 Tax=Fructobacillus sp. CRL 2054 TaxID=2763007 RepID=UPI0023794C13|nr:helix-turn-helix transcriptional regulator [Fructobacillus sp. CRL 2054]MDD9138349.1 helix-turn-helix transcriptional regulator [Fructobacillus sp. CRL 2054]
MNGNRLRILRIDDGLKLIDVSEKTGIPSNTLSNYERGKREPKLVTWEALAKFFNVTPQYLVGWTDEPIS